MDATATIVDGESHSIPIARSRTATSECSSSGMTTGGLSNAGSSSSSVSTTAVLRRDAARVLSGLFDPNGGAAFSNVVGGVRQESNIPSRDSNNIQTSLASDMNHPRRSKRVPAVTPVVNDPSNNTAVDDSGVLSAYYMSFPRSSFSYAPRSDDYSSPEPEFDYAAAYAWVNTPESATEDGDNNRVGEEEDGYSSSRPPTPPVDFLGMGTPIINPKLVAKVLKAIAEGQPLKMNNGINGTSGKGKGGTTGKGKAKRKDKDVKKGRDGADDTSGKKKDKKSNSSNAKSSSGNQAMLANNGDQQRGRAASNAPSNASSSKPGGSLGARNGAAGSSSSLAKRARSSTGDAFDEPSRKKQRAGSTATSSTTPAPSESRRPKPRQKCRKGWKGWVEIEVTDSEEDDEDDTDKGGATGAGATRGGSSSTRKSRSGADGDEDDDSDSEEVKGKKGWKGERI
ncbi:hypothetical protein FRC03_003899 [Tulasnella sp. 419]|nr:hypothetical protein FRC03_003899 [Tulasnella sp. 419]